MDLLKVKIDDGASLTEAYWFYNYADAMPFLNQDVIVDYRNDIIDGNMCQVINTFTVPTRINTLTRDTNIKLYADAEDNFATISFNDLEVGETIPGAVVYCVKQEYKASEKASWVDFTIRDKSLHIAHLRLFSYEDNKGEFGGKYIITNLTKSIYGFQSDYVAQANGEVPVNPEITIAESYIKSYFANNQPMLDMIAQTNLLQAFANNIDYEAGYGVVRLAQELAICEQLTNVTNSVNIQAIQEALVASHLYLTQPQSVLSERTRNIFHIIKYRLDNMKLILQILDEEPEEPVIERRIFQKIKSMTEDIIQAKKGVL